MSEPAFVIRGALPALMTPFNDDGSVNAAMIPKLVAYHMEQGCGGFFICGSTGDGFLLTRDERRTVAEIVVNEVGGKVPIIAHVGTISSDESAAIAEDARKAGVDAVASVPPIYYPVGIPGFVHHMQTIARAADLPTYCYYIPALTGHALGGDQFLDILDQIPNLVGLKYTHTDHFLLWWILDAAKGRYSVLNGSDQMFMQALLTGCSGGVGSTYNYQLKNIVAVYDAVQAGDLEAARQCQWKANQVIRVLFRFSGDGVNTERAIMKMRGLDVGPPRAPRMPFDEAKVPALRAALEEVGFFDE
ncbi:MAG: N-acetylneuraminate lyase [bacterium]|nr:N-acetylneuraminate lyase [bacterium]